MRVAPPVYTISVEAGVHGNTQPYTFLSIAYVSGLIFVFRATKIDETSVPYRYSLRSAIRFRHMFCAQRLPLEASFIPSDHRFQPRAWPRLRRARAGTYDGWACDRVSSRTTNRPVREN